MPLKKRMFRYNMVFLLASLLALLAVVLVVLVLFEDSLEQTWHGLEQEMLSGGEEAGMLEEGVHTFLQQSFTTLVAALLLAGAGAVTVSLILAGVFTRRMNRMVMEPLEELGKGALRIQSGNLKEEITYQGEEEFENLCRTFNSMQAKILENQEQKIRDERARTDMVTGISHDLRTPLTSIQGYIKGVLDGVADTPEKQKSYLETAYESTEEMNVLLQKLFDFSRMESGQMPFHMVNVNLGEFVDSWASGKEAVLEKEDVHIRLEREQEEMPEVPLDVEQVRRILENLLENSLKYAGVRPLYLDTRIRSRGDGSAELVWKDNGQGVPEEKLEQIFERFYRCDESRNQKGSGVGLYVVRYIMERHQGEIRAENEQGLKLTLLFPSKGGRESGNHTDSGR